MLFVGDDWSEEHHDVEVVDDDGRRLASVRLPEGLEGVTRLHTLVARFAVNATSIRSLKCVRRSRVTAKAVKLGTSQMTLSRRLTRTLDALRSLAA